MASTFSTNLAIELIGTGDQAGTWGTTTNSNLGTLIEQAISGYVTQAVATGTDTTITIPNGATGVARNMYIELTGTGGTNTNLIVPANKKLYFIFNNSTGAVTVKVSGQTGVSVPTGKKMVLVSNGTDIVNGLNYIADFGTNSFSVTNLTASSGTITNLIATSGSITNLVSSDASATVLRAGSATLTHLSATSASITNLSLTSLTISSLSITNVSVASATVSSNLTLSGGTANGVLYLNGSKVATSGSAIQFDGTNLLIGTTSGTNKLTVNGNAVLLANGEMKFADSTNSRVSVIKNSGGASTSQIDFLTGDPVTTRMTLDTSGNLGIGTASPSSALVISGDYLNNKSDIQITNTNGGRTWRIGDGIGAITSSLVFFDGTASAARMVLDSSGNLGIGTASPAAKLDASQSNPTRGIVQRVFNSATSSQTGTQIQFAQNSVADWVIGQPAGVDAFAFWSGRTPSADGTERMRLDTSGNLGLGVTPSAWGTSGTILKALQIGAAGSVAAGTVDPSIHTSQNAYFDGTNWNRIDTGSAAGNYYISGNTHNWRIAASGANPIAFTQAMTLDASGRLGIGPTSPSYPLEVSGPSSANVAVFRTNDSTAANNTGMGFYGVSSGTAASRSAVFWLDADGANFAGGDYFVIDKKGSSGVVNIVNASNAAMTFGTADIERGRFSAGGDLLVGTTSTKGKFTVEASGGVLGLINTNATVASGTRYHAVWYENGVEKGSVTSDGTNTAYNTSSDRRLKENISLADDAGAIIDAIQVVKHDWKNGGHTRFGVIAQDLNSVAPEAVNAGDDGEEIEKTWGVDYSKLVPMLVKEIQSLRSRVAALEAK